MGLLGPTVPGPGDAVRVATGAVNALDQALALVPRLTALVGRLEELTERADGVIGQVEDVVSGAAGTISRVDGVVARADLVVARTTGVVDGAEVVVGRTSGVVDGADAIVGRTGGVVDGADRLLDSGGRLVERITATTSDAELQAIVHPIDTLPQAVDVLRDDVLPVMSTLGTVAPDLHDLLDIASRLNGVIGSVPGLGRIRKRVERAQAEEDDYRADDEPPSTPPTRD